MEEHLWRRTAALPCSQVSEEEVDVQGKIQTPKGQLKSLLAETGLGSEDKALTMASQEVIGHGAALESLDDSKKVRVFISESGRHYLVIEAGEMKKVTTLGFGDGTCPVGSKVLVKDADINVGEPPEAHHRIDIDHPRNSFVIYKVLEDLKTDPFWQEFLGSSMSMGTNLEETYWKQKLYEACQKMPPVENYQEMPPGAIGMLVKADNTSKRSQMVNAWKTGISELSEEAHNWIKEVVGMGMMGISASAGYGSPSVIAKATCAFAFACSATAFFLPRKWITTIRFLTKVGAVACIGGVLAAIGQDLPLECKWWVTAFAFVAPAAAVAFS